MIEYPQGLPYPLRDGLSLQTVDPALRTQMQSGFARQRRQYTSTPTMSSVSWQLTEQQAVLFEAFFEEVLVSGSLWFECPMKTPMGAREYIARFAGMYSGPVLVPHNRWRISATLELRERPILRGGWALYAPDYILGSDLMDIAMNEKWPRA
jgi:hypothetical protein